MNEPIQFVLIDDIAKHFKVSVSTIRAWVRDGHIASWAYIKIGNTYRFNLEKTIESLFPAITNEKLYVPKQDLTETSEKPVQQPAKEALEFDFDADEDQ